MSEVLTLNHIAVLLILATAVYFDMRSRQVPNRFVLVAFAASLSISVVTAGVSGLWMSCAGFAAAFILGLPFYMMKAFAGGDFKLLLAISPLLTWQALVVIIATAFIWGALLGVIRVILSGEFKAFLHNLFSIFMRNKVSGTALHAIPFTVAIFFGYLSHLSLAQVGWRLL